MLNQGRPLLRVERSGARTGKGASREWTAPGPGFWGFGEVWWHMLFLLMVAVPALGVVSLPGWRVSGANTADHWVGGERSSLGGVKDHERSEYRTILERQEFVVRNGAAAEWRMTIS